MKKLYFSLRFFIYLNLCFQIPFTAPWLMHHIFIEFFGYIDPYWGATPYLVLASSIFSGFCFFAAWFLLVNSMSIRYYLFFLGLCIELIFFYIIKYKDIGFIIPDVNLLLMEFFPFLSAVTILFFLKKLFARSFTKVMGVIK